MKIPEVTPEQVKRRMDAGEPDLVLLDVRNPNELERARIEGVVHVPMDEVPAALDRLDRDADYVVICHHGQRSLIVCRFLLSRGYLRVANLGGGIDAWWAEVDPSVGRY